MKNDAYVIVKSKKQFSKVLESNPFNTYDPKKVGVLFFDKKPSPKILLEMTTQGKEEIEIGTKEIYIFFPDGMGRAKLKVPNESCTMRNLNSVTKLASMLDD